MGLWHEIKQRRITQIFLTYLAGGWMALAVVDQVVDREVLPPVVYEVGLTLYLFGAIFALVLGWYHGEKGHQNATATEIAILTVVGILGVGLSARLIMADLDDRSVASAVESSTMDLRRVAVLYFDDRSDDGSLAPVATALTEELIGSLARVQDLDVVSRNGSRRVQEQGLGPDEAASVLQAGVVVQGSVEPVGDDVRVTYRVRDGQGGVEIERESYVVPSDSLGSAPAVLSRRLSEAFRQTLGLEIRLRESRDEAPSTGAWLQVARAEKALKDAALAVAAGDAEAVVAAFEAADAELARARQEHPDWVRPFLLSGELAYERMVLAGSLDEALATLDEAVDYADQAMEREPESAAARELRGTATYRRWLLQAEDEAALDRLLASAQEDLEQSLDLDPRRASANSTLSHLYYQTGDWTATVLAAREAYQQDAYLDVVDGVLWRLYAGSYDLEDYEGARTWCLEGAERFPDHFRFLQCQLFLMTMDQGRPDVQEAWRLHDRLMEVLPAGQEAYIRALAGTVVGGILGRAGMADSADAVLTRSRLEAESDPDREILATEAAMRSVSGDVDGALDALGRYMIAQPGHFPRRHWWWDTLAGDPRFERLQASAR